MVKGLVIKQLCGDTFICERLEVLRDNFFSGEPKPTHKPIVGAVKSWREILTNSQFPMWNYRCLSLKRLFHSSLVTPPHWPKGGTRQVYLINWQLSPFSLRLVSNFTLLTLRLKHITYKQEHINKKSELRWWRAESAAEEYLMLIYIDYDSALFEKKIIILC